MAGGKQALPGGGQTLQSDSQALANSIKKMNGSGIV